MFRFGSNFHEDTFIERIGSIQGGLQSIYWTLLHFQERFLGRAVRVTATIDGVYCAKFAKEGWGISAVKMWRKVQKIKPTIFIFRMSSAESLCYTLINSSSPEEDMTEQQIKLRWKHFILRFKKWPIARKIFRFFFGFKTQILQKVIFADLTFIRRITRKFGFFCYEF